MNTGSANGQDWGVIDFPRNQSACWESTVRPQQMMGFNRRQVEMVQSVYRVEEKRIKLIIHTRED